MSNVDDTQGTQEREDVWHVQVAAGDVRTMTVDELDSAFQEGLIHENTFVLQAGTNEWVKLATVAGLDEEEGTAATAPDVIDAPHALAAAMEPVVVAPAAVPEAPVTLPAGSIAAAPSAVVAQPVYVQSAPAPAPAPARIAAAAPPASFAPAYSLPASEVSGSGLGSMRPVVADLDDFDLAPAQFRSKKRGVVIAAAAVLLLGGIGAAATMKPAGDAAAPVAVAANTPPPAAEPLPAATPATVAAADLSKDGRLSDDQRRALLDHDKARELQRKSRAATPRHSPRRPSSGPVFHSGGDPHDPLNGKL